MMRSFLVTLGTTFVCGMVSGADFASHEPMRPLPRANDRPLPVGPVLYVDAAKGNDANEGSKARPWKTLEKSLRGLKAGDTLCLRGGTYYEQMVPSVSGTKEAPVTIRSYPNELAVVDAGLREFHENPKASWRPFVP